MECEGVPFRGLCGLGRRTTCGDRRARCCSTRYSRVPNTRSVWSSAKSGTPITRLATFPRMLLGLVATTTGFIDRSLCGRLLGDVRRPVSETIEYEAPPQAQHVTQAERPAKFGNGLNSPVNV
ncbi:hypothetical protein MRX96_008756 [Rhipicephalus microplus]